MFAQGPKAPGDMREPRDDNEEFITAFRAKLQSSQVSSGRSLGDIAELVGETPERVRAMFAGKEEVSVSLLARYAALVERPVWWFFGDQPSTISIESAETALGNLARMRVYLDAIESEFRGVLEPSKPFKSAVPQTTWEATASGPVVVDFAPYLSRARAILEREADFCEDSEEVFEESVEMIAHSLYSIEMAATRLDSKEMPVPTSRET